MDTDLLFLQDADIDDRKPSAELRKQAAHFINKTSTTPDRITETLHDLLVKIVKPLFSKSRHAGITPSGRKNLVTQPVIPSRFSNENDSIFSNPVWKNGWTLPLLSWILDAYKVVPEPDQKTSIEAHFHFLVPPILILIDDHEVVYKAGGCDLLHRLSATLSGVHSEILKRTGLTEVFIDALKNSFHYLPSLTPEDDSLLLLKSLYPAYLSLIEARYQDILPYLVPISDRNSDHKPPKPSVSSSSSSSSSRFTTTTNNPTQISTDLKTRTTQLNLLLRHSLLHGISHLRTGGGQTPTTSVALTTYLLTQIPPLTSTLGVNTSSHLQTLIPMLIDILRDPFTSAATDMLLAAVHALEALVLVCWVRVRDRWWSECLRGVVECWLNVSDDLRVFGGGGYSGDSSREPERGKGIDIERKRDLQTVQQMLKRVIMVLEDVVGTEFEEAETRLVREEGELASLFGKT